MQRVAVTGTNGKTSTVEFARQLFDLTGHRAASYGTLGLVTPSGRDPEPSLSLGRLAVPAFLSRLKADGFNVVTLEAYSSSLVGDIFERVSVSVAAFTNLTRDHLDVHGDVESYFAAKRSLFEDVLRADGTAVVNLDDDRAEALIDCCRDRGVDVVTYGRKDRADISIREISPTSTGTVLELSVQGQAANIECNLIGDIMVENACCALACVISTGVEMTEALEAMGHLEPPPGRLERVCVHQGAEVFVDYAHTPAALAAVLKTLQKRNGGDVVVVFGCGGDRDRGKRRRMGAVAGEHADSIIVTDDNPRTEDPATIREAVLDGCPDARECSPRERAISTAFDETTVGDVVLVAGKGHERTQVIDGETQDFSDRDIVRRLATTARK